MALSSKTCRVFLIQKKDENKSLWENRISILEKVNGKNKEVLFVKNSSEEEFIQELKEKLKNKNALKHFSKIREKERYSKTWKEILKTPRNTKKVSRNLYNSVKELLDESRAKTISQKKERLVLT